MRNYYIVRPDEVPSFTPEGHKGAINRLLISEKTVGAKHMEVAVSIIQPEGLTAAHSHEVEQAMYMLEGRAYVEVEGAGEELKAGEIAFFPPGKMHSITPVGGTYKILTIFAPPMKTQT